MKQQTATYIVIIFIGVQTVHQRQLEMKGILFGNAFVFAANLIFREIQFLYFSKRNIRQRKSYKKVYVDDFLL